VSSFAIDSPTKSGLVESIWPNLIKIGPVSVMNNLKDFPKSWLGFLKKLIGEIRKRRIFILKSGL
jgi:hypothetical protein